MDRITKQNYKFNMLNIIQGMTKYTEIDEIMNCLAAYEDTGLTPEEISILKIKSESALDPIEMAKIAIALRERDALKKALELMATYLVHFGRLNEMLCDDIPQPLHLKYQPKNDGDYENEPCIQCVQEYYIQQAQEQEGKE